METTISNNVNITTALENQEVERNMMMKNQKFEQIDNKIIQKHIKKSFFSNVNNNTRRKNSLRICKIVNSVNYKTQNFIFHQTRFVFFILTFGEILEIYKQLLYVQFFSTFAQFTLSKIIDKINRNKLNEIE